MSALSEKQIQNGKYNQKNKKIAGCVRNMLEFAIQWD